ncbi:MAG: response regulator transcription factor [Chloroflexota bacterium]
MKKRSAAEIILLEPSYLVRSALSALLLEEFNKVTVYEEEQDFETLLAAPEALGASCLIVNSLVLDRMGRYLRNAPERVVIIPLYVSTQSPLEASRYKHSIEINDGKSRIIETVNRAINSLPSALKPDSSPAEALTKREQIIIQLVAKGRSSKQIADALSISLHTVVTHRKNISKKLQINSVSGLTVYAILNNLIKIEEAGALS